VLVPLLELHPGVDEGVLALEEEEGLEGVAGLSKLVPIHYFIMRIIGDPKLIKLLLTQGSGQSFEAA
jgi:hypothetical protein